MYPLIAPDELAELLAAPEPLIVLDVRWSLTGPPGRSEYEAGHLPDACYLDVDTDLSGPPGLSGRHPLPDPAALQATLRAVGVRPTVPVVAYDAADGAVAARLWWLLRWVGHPEVAVLDGGFAAWHEAGFPVTTARAVTPAAAGSPAGTITVRPGAMPVLDAARAASLARDGVLLDARAAPRYRGETEPIDPRAGHVPGARNAPFGELTDGRGGWLKPAGLLELARRWGVDGAEVGAYCGSGINACALVLGLEIAGVTSVRRPAALYAGSWSQWCTDPVRPVATGPDPG
ncbi:MAG: sulfurtransferase [Pseudonocardiaceae bacterium]